MSDDKTPGVFIPPAAGQQSGKPSNAEGDEDTSPYLTKKDAARLRQELREELLRTTQSVTDKVTSRVESKIKAEMQALTRLAQQLQLPAEQVEAARQKIIADAYGAEDLPATTSNQAAQPGGEKAAGQGADRNQGADSNSWAADQVKQIYKRAGLELNEGDPETEGLDKITDLHELIEEIRDRVQQKKTRLNIPPGARLPMGNAGAATNLKDQYKKELADAHGVDAVLQVQDKYKRMGLTLKDMS